MSLQKLLLYNYSIFRGAHGRSVYGRPNGGKENEQPCDPDLACSKRSEGSGHHERSHTLAF
jgi:hypothetical protein